MWFDAYAWESLVASVGFGTRVWRVDDMALLHQSSLRGDVDRTSRAGVRIKANTGHSNEGADTSSRQARCLPVKTQRRRPFMRIAQ